jgi:hypothetical protein
VVCAPAARADEIAKDHPGPRAMMRAWVPGFANATATSIAFVSSIISDLPRGELINWRAMYYSFSINHFPLSMQNIFIHRYIYISFF